MPRSLITYLGEGGNNDGCLMAAVVDHQRHEQVFSKHHLVALLEDFNEDGWTVSQLPHTFFPCVWDEDGEQVEVQHIIIGDKWR